MPITQFVLEPPLAIDWLHRPISSQIKKDKRKKNSSKLLILNDISIAGMLQEAKNKNVDVLLCSTDRCPELMLTPDVVGNNAKLQKLVDAYLKLSLAQEKDFSRGSLMLFARIMMCASDITKSYGMLETLKSWFQAPKDKISDLISKVKINEKYKLPKMEQAIKMFSMNIDYTEGILNFLWKLHGSNAWQKSENINSGLDSNTITVVPASIFKQDTYFYLLFIYGVISKMEVYIDTDVPFSLVGQYLNNSQNYFSIARYANSDFNDLSFLAANAQNMLSSAQIANQDLFFSWIALHCGDALKDYSLYEINDLLARSPYIRFVGMYFSLKKDQLGLTQYNLKAGRWKTLPFDLHLIREKSLPNSDMKNIPDSSDNKQQIDNSQNFKELKASEKATQEQLKKLFSDNEKTLSLLCYKVDSLLKNVNKTESSNEKGIEETDIKQLQPKLDEILNTLKDLPSSLNRKLGQFIESTNTDKKDKDDELSVEQINRDFEEALHSQNADVTDFDD